MVLFVSYSTCGGDMTRVYVLNDFEYRYFERVKKKFQNLSQN